jgi:DNA-directed RNA polymerase subunit RPC12/RpoP
MQQQFGKFTASELYCPKCGSAQPVRERLLLVLPSGELHEYLCAHCSTSLGEREVTAPTRKVAPAAPRPAANGTRRLLRG